MFNLEKFIILKKEKMENKMLAKSYGIKHTVTYRILVDKYNPFKWYIVKKYNDRHYAMSEYIVNTNTVKHHRTNQATFYKMITNNKIVLAYNGTK